MDSDDPKGLACVLFRNLSSAFEHSNIGTIDPFDYFKQILISKLP